MKLTNQSNRILTILTILVSLGLSYVANAGPAEKVKLCHVPPDDPSNSHTIVVSENAVSAHLEHGDSLNECSDDPTGEVCTLETETCCDTGNGAVCLEPNTNYCTGTNETCQPPDPPDCGVGDSNCYCAASTGTCGGGGNCPTCDVGLGATWTYTNDQLATVPVSVAASGLSICDNIRFSGPPSSNPDNPAICESGLENMRSFCTQCKTCLDYPDSQDCASQVSAICGAVATQLINIQPFCGEICINGVAP